MIFAFIYLLIGSTVAYFMQSQIKWLTEYSSEHWLPQTAIKILLDTWVGFTWVIAAPVLLSIVFYLKRVNHEEN